MNKELILEYKKEFEHWLKGGKILHLNIIDTLDWKDTYCDDIWLDTCITSYKKLIIINDEYVEFRKALAEGKIIQVYDVIKQHLTNPDLDIYDWRDFKSFTQSSSFTYSPDRYRIKPEEPKFKVGDWIIITAFDNKKLIVKYASHTLKEDILTINDNIHFPSGRGLGYVKPWQPQSGEWCWFWDEQYTTAILAKFLEKTDEGYFEHHGNSFEYCEPFIGELPTIIKDN